MDKKEFNKDFQEFLNSIDKLSDNDKKRFENLAGKKLKEIQKISEEKNRNKSEIDKVLNKIKNDLDFLRLHSKYLLFDLEATRRENTYLRRMLEDND